MTPHTTTAHILYIIRVLPIAATTSTTTAHIFVYRENSIESYQRSHKLKRFSSVNISERQSLKRESD